MTTEALLASSSRELGIAFTEVIPGTYHVKFVLYTKDKEIINKQAQYYLAYVERILAEHPGQILNFIYDTTAVKDAVAYLTEEAREEYMKAYAMPQVGRVAMVGMSPWLKTMMVCLAKFADRSAQTAFFDTPEEAIEWIKRAETKPLP